VALSKQERDRLILLRQVKERRMTQKAAAGQLGLSARWVKKLVKRMREQGIKVWRIGCGAAVQSRARREAATAGAGAGPGALRRLRADAGQRSVGAGARPGGEPGDAAAVDDRGEAVTAAAGEAKAGARVAAAAQTLRGVGAMGHLRA
jgi:biotin operon repressor